MTERLQKLETPADDEFAWRSAKDRPRERPCLCCGKQFLSAGWGNRLCNDCKRRGGRPG